MLKCKLLERITWRGASRKFLTGAAATENKGVDVINVAENVKNDMIDELLLLQEGHFFGLVQSSIAGEKITIGCYTEVCSIAFF